MSLNARLLVVDDDPSQREMLADFFRDLGAEVREAESGIEALETVRRLGPDVVVTDLRMPGLDGAELLREIKKINPDIGVVLVTAYGTVQGAVQCLRDGADDYLLKPLELDEVEHVVRRTLEQRHLTRENRELKRRLGEIESVPGIVTSGGLMAEVLSTVDRVARSTISVLIQGESGTGKELIARAIHAAGPRAKGPFVAVNAAALSPTLLESELFGHEKGAFTGANRARSGRFEAASGGTLFLDEIGDLPADVQVKLLRVLQERSVERVGSNQPIPVDVRVIAATHQDLLARVKDGEFREDLYYRLVVVAIELPPLRRRRGDVPLLVDHFLAKHRDVTEEEGKRFSREAMDLLLRYDFPGNVRELENIVQRCMVLARGDQITTADLPPMVASSESEALDSGLGDEEGSLPGRLAALERAAIEEALVKTGGNQSKAATQLGISERALRYKLSKFREKSKE
jgi:two-component system NtrC family response regulator